MHRARRPLPIAALMCAVALAGCGSGGSSSSGSSSSGKTSSSPAQSATSAGAQTQGTGTSTAPSGDVKAAVAECKQVIQSQAKLPSSAKTKLEGACAQAAKGNTQAVKTAAREVCEEVIGKANLPNGADKEAAQKACKQ
jgi:hypothetical protein